MQRFPHPDAAQRPGRILAACLLTAAVVFPAVLGASPIDGNSVTLGFVGDIMVHKAQLRRAWRGEDSGGRDRGYDFSPSFEWFSLYLQAPDWTMGNLETTFGGPNSAWIGDEQWAFREYQAYPCFTTPDSLAPVLADAGFDLLSTANNHCMDSNLEGAARTLEVLAGAGIPSTGTAAGAEPPRPWRGRVGGFDLAVLAWTASVNGLVSSRPGMAGINVFNARGHDDRLQDMLADIRREAAENHDLLILFIHWGQEYMDEPDRYQRNLADLALEAGADIIIGSHPHTLQPVERRFVDRDGDGPDPPREAFIAWSLGNFLSSQSYVEGTREWVDGSAMLNLDIERGSDGLARVSAAEMIPLYVQRSSENVRVLAAADGLAPEGAARYGLTDYDLDRLKAYDAWVPGQMTRYLGALPARRADAAWRVDFPAP